ncbi:Formamidopyrimidine-DNA glycosylase [Vitis vinifera]|uniref:Formamidopyrimidine-DNA glycosylase n=1 Tax=Vitis vinifera TaxID=29760 RepID=A0A438EIY8_VITVI|nr:Formamidopyrimidine-DNA glycosylase [Vitis vinifera]
MPELPEVEVARRAVEEHCVGKKITKAVIANDSKVIDGVSPSDFEVSLLGKTIFSATERFAIMGHNNVKSLDYRSAVKDTDEWPSKYSKLFIENVYVPDYDKGNLGESGTDLFYSVRCSNYEIKTKIRSTKHGMVGAVEPCQLIVKSIISDLVTQWPIYTNIPP